MFFFFGRAKVSLGGSVLCTLLLPLKTLKMLWQNLTAAKMGQIVVHFSLYLKKCILVSCYCVYTFPFLDHHVMHTFRHFHSNKIPLTPRHHGLLYHLPRS